MKTAISLLVVLTAFSSILCAGQTSSEQSIKAFIEIGGVKLRLGMSKSEVAEKLVGSAVTKINGDWWVLGKVSPSLQFTDGRLSFADRTWSTTEDDIAESLFGVVNSFNAEGYSACKISADISSSPASMAQRVWIDCGEKTILVMVDQPSSSGKGYSWVSERLGKMRDFSK
ncbi:MAG: hypothetical protein WA715_00735 [Candidatus Acidiferrum sp.]|jgi:hypothetical protein